MGVAKLHIKKATNYFVNVIFLAMYNRPGQAILTRETFAIEACELFSKSWDKIEFF